MNPAGQTSRVSLDHLKMFCSCVQECRSRSEAEGGKAVGKHWTDMEKAMQVISKISDPSAFEGPNSSGDPISDLHWLVTRATASFSGGSGGCSFAWQALAILTRLSARSSGVRHALRDRLRTLSALTDLLCALPPTSNERRVKVLDLLRAVTCEGVDIGRMEAFLLQLVPRLVL